MGPPGQLFIDSDAGVTVVAGSVATAATDGTRLISGTSRGCSPTPPPIGSTTTCPVSDGPFVLTDARALDRGNTTWLYVVTLTTDCSVVTICDNRGVFASAGVELDALVGLATHPDVNGSKLADHLSGGRYFVDKGHRLCVCGAGAFSFGTWRASWAGFVPYQ
jgi:hypothetical protein